MKKINLIIILSAVILTSCKTDKYADLKDGMYADIETKYGNMLVQLEFEKTPMTVANFVSLAEGTNEYVDEKYKGKRFFDGLKFHRVIPNFMIQGGDPLGTGRGNPGYKFKDEFDATLTHIGPGILSMANSGPATNGSQFFITHKATPHLNNRHTVFGHVIKEGQEIVNAIQKEDILEKVTIIRKGASAKAFNATKVFSKGFGKMEEKAKEEKEKQEFAMKSINDKEAKATAYDSGLKIFFEKEGSGAKPRKGDKVKMHYTGYLKNGKVFDSSVNKGVPFETPIGVGRVIQGWDEGVVKMKVGSKAIFYIPAHLAYGSRGAGKAIPPNADIIFEVELLDIIK